MPDSNSILFQVTAETSTGRFAKMHAIVDAPDRETAKKKAYEVLMGDPEKYTVEPLVAPGELVMFVFGEPPVYL